MSRQKVVCAIASCLNCGWVSESPKGIIRRCRYHAKTKNHIVSVEITKYRSFGEEKNDSEDN